MADHILRGTADRLTPLSTARKFAEIARSAGGRDIEIIEFAGREHGFFNVDQTGDMVTSIGHVVRFMRREGW